MESNVFKKLSNMREAIRKEQVNNFSELAELVSKKAKHYKLIPLYCYYDNVATLAVIDMDEITSKAVFQIPVDLVGVKNAKEYLYCMAFDVELPKDESITPKQYLNLLEKMKEVSVSEKDIKERYQVNSLADMTLEKYKRCISALNRMK